MKRKRSSAKQLALRELVHAASALPLDSLLALSPLVGALSSDTRGRLTPGTVRRAAMRWMILRRYAQLRADPANDGLSERRIHDLVVDEARFRFPSVKVSSATLRRWIKRYNAVGPDGLAAGPLSLIEFRGRPHKRQRGRGRPSKRI